MGKGQSSIPGGRCTHAGGIVYRRAAAALEYLLVRPRKGPEGWVLPKGHIEKGEKARDAALREVLEEAGVNAAIVAPLGRLQMNDACAEMFLMRFVADGNAAAERACTWLNFDAAIGSMAFVESRDLLASAAVIAERQE